MRIYFQYLLWRKCYIFLPNEAGTSIYVISHFYSLNLLSKCLFDVPILRQVFIDLDDSIVIRLVLFSFSCSEFNYV